MAGERRTIVFMPESAYGPTNNCIGIGKVLERRGHRVVFAAEASWKGKLEPLGFEEDLVDLSPAAEADQDARQELQEEPYKLELIGLKGNAGDAAEGADAEVGGG